MSTAITITLLSMAREPLPWPFAVTLGGFNPPRSAVSARAGLIPAGERTNVFTTLTTLGDISFLSLTSLWRPTRDFLCGANHEEK